MRAVSDASTKHSERNETAKEEDGRLCSGKGLAILYNKRKMEYINLNQHLTNSKAPSTADIRELNGNIVLTQLLSILKICRLQFWGLGNRCNRHDKKIDKSNSLNDRAATIDNYSWTSSTRMTGHSLQRWARTRSSEIPKYVMSMREL